MPLSPASPSTVGPPWRAAAIASAARALTGDAEPTPARLLACGDAGRRLEQLRREMERAGDGLPPWLDGLRRTRLVAWDRSTTLWEAWHGESGARMLVRALRPSAQNPARLFGPAREPGAPVPVFTPADGATNHIALGPYRGTLADVLPIDDPDDPPWRARVLCGALASLARLHARGTPHGLVCAELLVQVDDESGPRWRLAWPGPVDGSASFRDDLCELGRLGEALGDPFIAGFADDPPPSAADAAHLYAAALGSELHDEWRRLWRRARRRTTGGSAVALAQLAARLERASSPPRATGCIQAGRDGVLVLARSDGVMVRGGASANPAGVPLPLVVAPDMLDTAGARRLLRAWAARDAGDPARREAVTKAHGGTDAELVRLLEWISTRLRLRTERLLLAARIRGAQ